MINSPNHIAEIETVLIKLTLKQKQFIYQIARLEYRIYKSLTKLSEVNILIAEEENNLNSLNAAIKAAGEGKVKDKLSIWKTKTEYKLFKLNLRKNKIDIPKVVINQSKLEELKQALMTLETDIKEIEVQKSNIVPHIIESKTEENNVNTFSSLKRINKTKKESTCAKFLETKNEGSFKMAS